MTIAGSPRKVLGGLDAARSLLFATLLTVMGLGVSPQPASAQIFMSQSKEKELGAAEHLVKPTTREVLCATALRLARPQAAPQIEAPLRLSA